MTGPAWHHAATLTELKEGVPRRVIVQDQMVMLLRQGGTVYASHALCPHKYGSLVDGEVHEGCVTCPVHDATFDLRTGLPGRGEEWANVLQIFPVRVEGDAVLVQMGADLPPG